MSVQVPYIPENAPFTPEQRSWLNGYFAGLFSRMPADPAVMGGGEPTVVTVPVTASILFGSQSGNAEMLSKQTVKRLKDHAFDVAAFDMADFPVDRLAHEENVIVITSTYGDGDPPDNAEAFWESLAAEDAPRLEGVRFAVLALGDTNYAKFCEFGKHVDRRLEELGASRMLDRVDCDVDYDDLYESWMKALECKLGECDGGPPENGSKAADSASGSDKFSGAATVISTNSRDDGKSAYSKKNPYPARLVSNANLNGEGSVKETRHVAIGLAGGELPYEAGDALGILPANCAEYVEELIAMLGASGEESVEADGREISLREALMFKYDVTRLNRPFVKAVAERLADPRLMALSNGEFDTWSPGREIIDVLAEIRTQGIAPAEFVSMLKPLAPRLYSIASSPRAHAGEIHLTVGIVRYEANGRARKGVCSTYLAERVGAEDELKIYIQPNKNFRLPADPATPVIMVGPGTGIAPFRAFLHDRKATGATGKNWLFFGNPNSNADFLYRDELESLRKDGYLARLDTAFSRDQAQKVYVQHRIEEQAAQLYAWLEEGAHFYVCGDASRMANDVDLAMHKAIMTAGGKTEDQAAEYVKTLKAEKRYQRDVY